MSNNIDAIFNHIGELGFQQWKYVLSLSLIHTYFPFHMLVYTFAGRKLNYECFTEGNNGTDGGVLVSALDECPEEEDGRCSRRVFDEDQGTSLVSDWDLECERFVYVAAQIISTSNIFMTYHEAIRSQRIVTLLNCSNLTLLASFRSLVSCSCRILQAFKIPIKVLLCFLFLPGH